MYNEITVCVNDIANRNSAIKVACRLAERYNGVVTAVYIKLDSIEIMRWQGSSPMELANNLLTDLDKKEDEAKQAFEQLAGNYQCQTVWRTVLQSAEPVEQMICTDLIFAEQPRDTDQSYPNHQSFLNHLILETKRPVVMIPAEWSGDRLDRKIILGWNSSAEAMRAAADALPFMEVCDQVTILDIMTERMFKREGEGLYHIQDYLSRKKINNQLIIDGCDKSGSVPSTLLSRAEKEQADMIVVGGYGHSRLREVILGGMTDYLIRRSTIPVLFSH